MSCGKQIQNRIRELCASKKISVNKLAEMSGLPQTTLDSLIQSSSPNPKINTLLHIANGFGMTLPEFLDTEEIKNAGSEGNEDEDI
jgi:transcriptional regulator with XRE-family HTH domain